MAIIISNLPLDLTFFYSSLGEIPLRKDICNVRSKIVSKIGDIIEMAEKDWEKFNSRSLGERHLKDLCEYLSDEEVFKISDTGKNNFSHFEKTIAETRREAVKRVAKNNWDEKRIQLTNEAIVSIDFTKKVDLDASVREISRSIQEFRTSSPEFNIFTPYEDTVREEDKSNYSNCSCCEKKTPRIWWGLG